jgi:hypothetical protein
MATLAIHANVQAVRRVYEDEETAINATPGRTTYIVCHPDASTGGNILLWDDILVVFSSALYARSRDVVLPFLKGPNFKK